MPAAVRVETVTPRLIAAVRRQVRIGEVGLHAMPALDLVWAFLKRHPDLRADGHNIFLYQHPARRGDPMEVDFGVEVVRAFTPEDDIRPVSTPAGEVAAALHVGPYDRIKETHDAIHAWTASNGRQIGAASWEIYGDWNEDVSKLETEIVYLLR